MNPKHFIRINEIHDRKTASVQSDDIVTYRSDPIQTFNSILSSQKKNGCARGAEEKPFPLWDRNESANRAKWKFTAAFGERVKCDLAWKKRCREIIMTEGITNDNHGNFNDLTVIAYSVQLFWSHFCLQMWCLTMFLP